MKDGDMRDRWLYIDGHRVAGLGRQCTFVPIDESSDQRARKGTA
jgi:hypothetical protein